MDTDQFRVLYAFRDLSVSIIFLICPVIAVRLFRQSAEQGDAAAQFTLGLIYDLGRGVPQDKAEAARWYRMAAEQGDDGGQYHLGRMYYDGDGMPKDDAVAIGWFRKAAAQGDAGALYYLGVMYALGEGISRGDAAATRYFRNAAEQGHLGAQAMLTSMQAQQKVIPKVDVQDYTPLYTVIGLAAKQGDAEAHHWFTGQLPEGDSQQQVRIDRFDRDRDAQGTILLRHQEDMLQALGLSPGYKYQRQGGPSLRDVAKLLREEALNPETDIATLADWQLLNFLLGNWDGHAKNLALLYEPGTEAPALAPFYDIVSVEYINVTGGRWGRNLVFAVGEHHSPERVTRADWERMAKDLGMSPARLLDRLEDFARRLPAIAEQSVEAFEKEHGAHQAYRHIPGMIEKRRRWIFRPVFANPNNQNTA